jgi:predicted 3-demethylubiquinone-9 3-methyltransferase (glyoxalase superfamily)
VSTNCEIDAAAGVSHALSHHGFSAATDDFPRPGPSVGHKRSETMPHIQKITPCLWFDGQAEQAAKFYTGIFDNSKITSVSRYGEAGREVHGRQPGSVMAVAFELDGHSFSALNGGPMFKFTEAISFQVMCETQEQVDYFWDRLSEGGDEGARQCGCLKDKFGVSWQVVPTVLSELLSGPDAAAAGRAAKAMMQMKKLDIAELRRARDAG